MAEIVISVAAKVAGWLVDPIRRQICYVFKYHSNMEELKKQVEKLTDVREAVQHSVDEATKQGDEIEKVVQKWLGNVDEFTTEVVKPITDDEDKAKKLCSIGFCSNLMTCYSLSRKAVKTTKHGISLSEEAKFQEVSFRPPLRKTTSRYIRGYEDFDSRKPVFYDIMEALGDATVNLIGVYGMGGVGKTTLVKRVVGQVIEDRLFDVVVIVDVTQTPDIRKIQAQIGDELGLKFEEESLSGRAARLRDRLKKEMKVLLVLDDIWKKLDLEAVGIPLGEEEKRSVLQKDREGKKGNQIRQCKLLMTSRSEVVLSNDMDTKKNFLVRILSDEEAGDLFWKTVGDSAKNSDLDPIGVEIVEYCGGLPVAITTIATALKRRDLSDWKDALNQLRRANPRHIKGMDANIYSAIKLSYDFLETEEAKSLFLICSLFNASSNIGLKYLLRYCMGFGLFQDVSTLEQARNRLHSLISSLKASCLLLDGDTKDDVKMHDIIHVVAVSIASTEKLMFNIQDVSDLKDMLEERLPKDSTAISLCFKDFSMLPERLEYPKHKLFFLFMNEVSLQLSDTIFERLQEIKVLDMTRIPLLSLPSSLSKLTNLQTLCMDWCQLGNVAIIGELKRLEILSFQSSDIEQLPEQIGQLTRLRLLELSDCSKLKFIAPNVLSSLTRLEELYMGNSFIEWDVEGQSNASLFELKQLSRLTTLEIHVLDAQIIPKDFLILKKLERYRIFIGSGVWEWFDNYESSKLSKCDKLKSLVSDCVSFQNLVTLEVSECNGLVKLMALSTATSLVRLTKLKVTKCELIEEIICSLASGKVEDRIIFNQLKYLELHCLPRLMSFYFGKYTIEFPSLQQVTIRQCPNMKIFSQGTLSTPRMHNLQITEAEEEGLWEGSLNATIQKMFKDMVGFHDIENLVVSDFPRLKEVWSKQFLASYFKNLKSLVMDDKYFSLRYIFTPSMALGLVQLQHLQIKNCAILEIIVLEEERIGSTLFPHLNSLELKDLSELTSFCNFVENAINLPSLDSLWIYNCPNMETFISNSAGAGISTSKNNIQTDKQALFDEKVQLSSLTFLRLDKMDKLRKIWHHQLTLDSFCKLKYLVVHECHNVLHVFPSNMLGRLQNLDELWLRNCSLLDEVFELQASSYGKRKAITATQLKKLVFNDLPKLQHIWDLNSQGLLTCQNLLSLEVTGCDNLESIFPASVGRNLLLLEELRIEKCCMVKEIFAKEEEVDETVPSFPQLTYMKLVDLPKLRSFCPRAHISEWPMLKDLQVWNCNEVVLSTSKYFSFQKTDG